MRRVDENRAENFIRKHKIHRKWIAFALCISLLTGTCTLYMLNKPATAMTEEGAKNVGLVLETADSEYEQGLIEKMEEEEQAQEEQTAESTDAAEGEETSGELTEAAEGSEDAEGVEKETAEGEEKATAEDAELKDKEDAEGSEIKDKEKTDKDSEKEISEKDKKADEKKDSKLKESEDEEKELEEDVVLTASYVDTEGNSIADDKEMNISESFDPATEASEVEGYTFKEASIDGEVITLITALKDEESEHKFFEVTLDGGDAVKIKEDKTVVLTYASEEEEKEEKESEEKKSVVLTAKYVDRNGEEIQDAQEISFAEETELTKENAKELEGYFYMNASFEDQEIVKIAPVAEDEEVTEEVKESKEDSGESVKESEDTEVSEAKETSEETKDSEKSEKTEVKQTDANESEGSEESEDEVKTVYVGGYILTTAEGETIEIKEDAEICFNYIARNTQEVFEFVSDEYTVKVTLADPSELPDGVELKVTTVDKDTEGYNYDAYMKALNENADKLAAKDEKIKKASDEKPLYDEKNTVLFDVAFILDSIEYEPKNGAVSVSITFNKNQISKDLEAENKEDVAVVHLPIAEEIMQEVASTSEATDISASDVMVEVLSESIIDIEGATDKVSFETSGFSVFAAVKNIDIGTYSWTGTGSKYNTASSIITSLGKAIYFGVVADRFGASSHFESNVAINTLESAGTDTLFDYDANYIHHAEFTNYKVSVLKRSSKSGEFSFALFKKPDGTEKIDGSEFTIKAESLINGWYEGTAGFEIAPQDNSTIFVFELDQNGDPIKDGEEPGEFKVSYTSDFQSSNDAYDALLASYITNKPDDQLLVTALHPDSSVYYSTEYGYEKATNIRNQYLEKKSYEGSLPIKADELLERARNLSKELPYAASSDSVEVFNVIADSGKDYMWHLANAYNEVTGEELTNNDIKGQDKPGMHFDGVGDGKILVINFDLTAFPDRYFLGDYKINGTVSADDWADIDSKIIVNFVQQDSDGNYKPYEGTLEVDDIMGTVLAPNATVHEDEINGAVIGKNVHVRNGEIHKYTLISYLELQGLVTVTNEDTQKEVKIEAQKYIDGVLAEETDSNKFSFNLKILSDDKKEWRNLANEIPNIGSSISYKINTFEAGMTYGKGKSYYFLLAENDPSDTSYVNDKTAILIKIDYFNDCEKHYYRLSEADIEEIFKKPKKVNNYTDSNREITDNGVDDSHTKVAFFNKSSWNIDLMKLLDDAPSSEIYTYWLRMVDATDPANPVCDNRRQKAIAASTQTNDTNGEIHFTVDPVAWGITQPGNYYFLIWEPNNDINTYKEGVHSAKTLDKGTIVVKVSFDGISKIEKTYYKLDNQEFFEGGNYCNVINQPLEENIVTGADIAFKNYKKAKISVSVIKEWDDLIGKNKNSNEADSLLTPDSIFDVTVKLMYSDDGGQTWNLVEDGVHTFETPNIYQPSQGALFEGTMGEDYDEPWTGRSKPYEFNDLNPDYQYKVEEWYKDKKLGEYSADGGTVSLNNATVNGYKLEFVNVETDLDGNITFTLHNKPYLQIQKYWMVAGNDSILDLSDTEGFNPVYVRLYRSFNKGENINVTSELAGQPNVIKVGEDYLIELNYANSWFAEYAVPRKMDDETDANHVRQCTYTIVECYIQDGQVIECSETPNITYGSIRNGNSTRDLEAGEINPDGFHSKTITGKTALHSAWVQGNNYPEIILTVTNVRGTNVLPQTGGIGEIPYLASGIGIAVAGLLGGTAYSRKKKKDDQEEE